MTDIITQVSPDAYTGIPTDEFNAKIHLNIRGTMFTITRDELMSLPESILLCLFPNGVFVDIDGNVITNLTEEDVVYVNFSPECFQYILNAFGAAAVDLVHSEHDQYQDGTIDAEVLHEKPSIIVLREDLDYYCIPPKDELSAEQMREIKLAAGSTLVGNSRVFDGLGYVPGKLLGAAEKHLLDMLCASGYSVEDLWGHRSMEPGKTVVNSLALVRLTHPQDQESEISSPALSPSVSSTSLKAMSSQGSTLRTARSRFAHLAHSAHEKASRSVSRNRSRSKKRDDTSSKLLLFWRKPARKCWWSHEILDVPVENHKVIGLEEVTSIKVHIRRVWTLELSVIGVN
ncbi:hypothetical protein BABINDRAFT_32269 [Babjeviella inositovora NRRL Y-12698]|uniref:Potassium channel tetramerisation-type BTB domain-containing protein n=1 Tax=Babjeviella inositovora NRRL Y-12698 TaxID=984486 RepID=A0A1E3QWB7_9ASCO|nr:uncharacterized protein BABINDRAFT_32269 [Babjeviella inositovora NRRL Y-12698]ODQ81921.1 hypothetical protein BABINDRAFT_32269 [Babjeviella inositovora NRRL Y-12698]